MTLYSFLRYNVTRLTSQSEACPAINRRQVSRTAVPAAGKTAARPIAGWKARPAAKQCGYRQAAPH
ncbi:hypothetical protein [Christensenella intestinihominis]|uniref:hypothetical protein n=1 Tax=Christensenella intestinihominis TaxID=1851429 RepID=UPI0015609229|nr:hypothetical protein [Christensenella intestinihominis]